MTICIPVSNGELMDKFSILLIKKEFIKDISKLDNVNIEIEYLIEHINNIKQKFDIDVLFSELIEVNKQLWVIEDNIRQKEKNKEFDKEFIEISRSVYFTNDKRCEIKNKINLITNSLIFEVKSYEKYD